MDKKIPLSPTPTIHTPGLSLTPLSLLPPHTPLSSIGRMGNSDWYWFINLRLCCSFLPSSMGSFPQAAALQVLLQLGSVPWTAVLHERTAPPWAPAHGQPFGCDQEDLFYGITIPLHYYDHLLAITMQSRRLLILKTGWCQATGAGHWKWGTVKR